MKRSLCRAELGCILLRTRRYQSPSAPPPSLDCKASSCWTPAHAQFHSYIPHSYSTALKLVSFPPCFTSRLSQHPGFYTWKHELFPLLRGSFQQGAGETRMAEKVPFKQIFDTTNLSRGWRGLVRFGRAAQEVSNPANARGQAQVPAQIKGKSVQKVSSSGWAVCCSATS